MLNYTMFNDVIISTNDYITKKIKNMKTSRYIVNKYCIEETYNILDLFHKDYKKVHNIICMHFDPMGKSYTMHYGIDHKYDQIAGYNEDDNTIDIIPKYNDIYKKYGALFKNVVLFILKINIH